jgi:hypothetical protein
VAKPNKRRIPKLTKLTPSEAKSKKRKRRVKGTIAKKHMADIMKLGPDETGRYWVKDDKEAAMYRNRIMRAAKALDKGVEVEKIGHDLLFWKIED